MLADDFTQRVLAYAERHSVRAEPHHTEVPGLSVVRHFRPTELVPTLYWPIFCLVQQGAKQACLGREIITFAERKSVIVGLELPTFARIVEATPDRPYVAVALRIDVALLKELAAETGLIGADDGRADAIAAGEADDAVVNAMNRLFGLIDKPAATAVLGPLIVREIHFWLLSASHGSLLRQLVRTSSNVARIAQAIAHLRRNYAEPLRVPALARSVGMSESAFHEHFKAFCGTTPLQYQKRLRLMEARRLMVAEGKSVSSAAIAVGYESPTQFSREFSRLFGASPRAHRRAVASGLALDVGETRAQ